MSLVMLPVVRAPACSGSIICICGAWETTCLEWEDQGRRTASHLIGGRILASCQHSVLKPTTREALGMENDQIDSALCGFRSTLQT